MAHLTTEEDMSLTDRIHALPPELFNRVRDHFLAVDKNEVVVVNPTYKPPVQLQLCKCIREQYAKDYYSRIFNFASLKLTSDLFYKWINSGPKKYTVDVNRRTGTTYWTAVTRSQFRAMQGALNRQRGD